MTLASNVRHAIAVADEHGVFVSSSLRHAARIGRPIVGVIGASWRDWTPAACLAESERNYALALGGEPRSMAAAALRPGGIVVTSRVLLLPSLSAEGKRIVVGVHSEICIPDANTRGAVVAARLDKAAYVAELAAELARMASGSGLARLADSLEVAAGRAGEVVAAAERRRLLQ